MAPPRLTQAMRWSGVCWSLRLPFLFFARNLGFPMQMRVIELSNLLHPFHEVGKPLELRPLVIGRPHRHLNLNGFLDIISLLLWTDTFRGRSPAHAPTMQPDSYSSRYDLPSKEHSAWHDEQCPRYQYGLSFSLSNPGALSGGNARAPLKPPLPVWSSPNGPPTAGSFMTGSCIVDLRGSCSLSTSICATSSLIDGERSVVSFFVRLGVS